MKKLISLVLLLALCLSLLGGCGGTERQTTATVTFTDSCDRQVSVPENITRVAPSGATAQMILLTLAPELLVGLSSTPDAAQLPYLPENFATLPAFGQFYGSKANLNMEALIAADPEIIIDLGDAKKGIHEDMDSIQSQTGIPTVFIQADLAGLAEAYRMLGKLLHLEDRAEKLAAFIERTLNMAAEKSALIPAGEQKTVYFGTGADGLACNASGSAQADAIELIGAVNAVQTEEVSNRNGGTPVDLELVYTLDPDVIILTDDGPYETLADGEWSELTAVRSGSAYEIPSLPYNWMCMPPSVNRIIGIWWLGQLIYPELYDHDMVAVAKEFYSLFWHYELSDAEAQELLANSTMK